MIEPDDTIEFSGNTAKHTSSFERRLNALKACGVNENHLDAVVFVHDTIETAAAIAIARFGQKHVTPEIVLAVYDRLIQEMPRTVKR